MDDPRYIVGAGTDNSVALDGVGQALAIHEEAECLVERHGSEACAAAAAVEDARSALKEMRKGQAAPLKPWELRQLVRSR